ncbi:MAG TPA: hypothetical protein VIT92_14550 [Burkholderiaceae bacterium]
MHAPYDSAAVHQRQQAARASGDYAGACATVQLAREQLAETCDVRRGHPTSPDALVVPGGYRAARNGRY